MAEIQKSANVVFLKDVKSETTEWLWPDKIPLGMYSMLVGVQGGTKSFLSLYMAAQISTGRPWADGEGKKQTIGSTIILSTEDSVSKTIKPRLQAAQADMGKIAVIPSFNIGDKTKGLFNLTKDLDVLWDAVKQIPDLRLIIIDPISAYMEGKDENKNSEVREYLMPLSVMAAEKNIAIVGISHLNKNESASAEHRVIGSTGISATARAMWLIQTDQKDRDRRKMLFFKGNLSPKTTGLAYRITSAPIVTEDGKTGQVGYCLFEKGILLETAKEELAPPQGQNGRPRKQESAGDWLWKYLSDGPKPAADVYRDGKTEGYSERTLQNVKKKDEIQAVKNTLPEGGGYWEWSLPTLD